MKACGCMSMQSGVILIGIFKIIVYSVAITLTLLLAFTGLSVSQLRDRALARSHMFLQTLQAGIENQNHSNNNGQNETSFLMENPDVSESSGIKNWTGDSIIHHNLSDAYSLDKNGTVISSTHLSDWSNSSLVDQFPFAAPAVVTGLNSSNNNNNNNNNIESEAVVAGNGVENIDPGEVKDDESSSVYKNKDNSSSSDSIGVSEEGLLIILGVDLILSLTGLIFSIILVMGAHKARSCLMQLWIFVDILLLIGSITLTLMTSNIFDLNLNPSVLFTSGSTFSYSIYLLPLDLYFLLVVYFHLRELKSQSQILF